MSDFFIPAIGQKFHVSFKNCKDNFDAVITKRDTRPENSDREYTVIVTKQTKFDNYNYPDFKPGPFVNEVEANWFNTELTGRKIEIV